ncbi:MAG: cupin domain-containing protein [Planctomycetota bacterium]
MSVKRVESIPSEPVPAGTGTKKKVLISSEEGPNFAMRRFEIAPGGSMPNHTNTVEHEQYVVAGRATVGIGDEVHTVEAGCVVFIPAGVPHWYRTEGDEPFAFLCLIPNARRSEPLHRDVPPDEVEIVG